MRVCVYVYLLVGGGGGGEGNAFVPRVCLTLFQEKKRRCVGVLPTCSLEYSRQPGRTTKLGLDVVLYRFVSNTRTRCRLTLEGAGVFSD